MVFREKNLEFKFGEILGYLLAYFVFTSAFFFILTITKRALPIANVIAITSAVAIIGLVVKRLLR